MRLCERKRERDLFAKRILEGTVLRNQDGSMPRFKHVASDIFL
jgi:hypothetical protein